MGTYKKWVITGITGVTCLCYTLQRPVNAHFEAVSGLQFCWQAQDFQAFFIGKGAKVLVYAVFRACGNFRGLWPQTFRPQSRFSCHGARWLVDALGGDGPRGVGHGAGLASQLGCRGGRAAKSRGQDRLKEEHTITSASMPKNKNARVSRAYDYQSIHAQTRITFVFREHTITRASMPKT